MMRQLDDAGLIVRSNGRVRITDEARLAAIGNHIDRYVAIDLSWLPAPPR